MTIEPEDLLGAWRLEEWSLVYADGRAAEFPLGADAAGFLMYSADGHVSATLMRSGRAGGAPVSVAEKAVAYDAGFAYAGRYEVRDNTVFHSIEVATNPALVGVTSTRHIRLEGNRLSLSGPDFAAGSARTQRIVWQRAE